MFFLAFLYTSISKETGRKPNSQTRPSGDNRPVGKSRPANAGRRTVRPRTHQDHGNRNPRRAGQAGLKRRPAPPHPATAPCVALPSTSLWVACVKSGTPIRPRTLVPDAFYLLRPWSRSFPARLQPKLLWLRYSLNTNPLIFEPGGRFASCS